MVSSIHPSMCILSFSQNLLISNLWFSTVCLSLLTLMYYEGLWKLLQPHIWPACPKKNKNNLKTIASACLLLQKNWQITIERFRTREGHYPERVLADKIYRNRENLSYCKLHGIRLSGPALGRPKKDERRDRKQTYLDQNERIEVERQFSLAKRRCNFGKVKTKTGRNHRFHTCHVDCGAESQKNSEYTFALLAVSRNGHYGLNWNSQFEIKRFSQFGRTEVHFA